MPPSVDPKVLAVADRVLARNCSAVAAIEEGFVALVDSKSEGASRCNVRRHVQKGRDAAQSKAEAGTAKHYTTAAKKAAAAAQLLATAAAVGEGREGGGD